MDSADYKDPRSVDELIRDALTDDEEISDRAVVVLHYKGSREVLEAATQLSRSSLADERSLAAVIVVARDIADVRLVPILTELQESWAGDEDRHVRLLQEALSACIPNDGPLE